MASSHPKLNFIESFVNLSILECFEEGIVAYEGTSHSSNIQIKKTFQNMQPEVTIFSLVVIIVVLKDLKDISW